MLSILKKIFNKKIKVENSITLFSVKVPECIGNRYVIADIHGCLDTFRALITRLLLTKNDQVFLLGDYIDRGKNSKGVIDEIIKLKDSGLNIFALRGNHEDDLLILYTLKNKRLISKYMDKENNNTLFNKNYEIDDKYLEFLNKLPYYFELKDFLLVHAGFNFSLPDPFKNTFDMLWIRDFTYDPKLAKGKTIIHGHDPWEIEEIKKRIEIKNKIVPLDNGCVFYDCDGFGSLLCLNLNTFEIIIQENLENM